MKLATKILDTPQALTRVIRSLAPKVRGTPLLIRAYPERTVSYHLIASAIAEELSQLGFLTELLDDDCTPAHLAILPPSALRTMGRLLSQNSVLYTSFESPRLPKLDFELLSNIRAIIVPSNWNAACLSAQGLDTAIHVCPFGFHKDLVKPHRATCSPRRFATMAHGHTGLVRKNVASIIRSFLLAFGNGSAALSDIQLHVKCSEEAKLALCSELQIIDSECRIIWNTKHMSSEELYAWISSMDAGVFAPACEGFGLSILEFIASGVPIATTNYGGQAEYLSVGLYYKIEAELYDALDTHVGLGTWSFPSSESLISAFRDLYSNYTDWSMKAKTAAGLVGSFSWQASTSRLVSLLSSEGINL